MAHPIASIYVDGQDVDKDDIRDHFSSVVRTIFSVIDKDLATPPGSPSEDDYYIVAASPTGDWAGQANNIAFFKSGAWNFFTPPEGTQAWTEDENTMYAFNGTSWSAFAGGGSGVDSFKGRTGAVVPAASDYDASQVDNDSTVDGASVLDALQHLDTNKSEITHGHAFLDLTDTPSAYTGHGSKVVSVNSGATALEFTTPAAGGGGGAPNMIYTEEHSNGTSKQGTQNQWNTRELNTEQRDADSNGSLSSNVLTLDAGDYIVIGWAVTHRSGRNKTRIRRTNNTATTLVVGSGMNAQNANNTTNKSHIVGEFTITAGDTIEFQHFLDDTGAGTNNMGVASTNATDTEVEVYSMIMLWKVS